MDVGTKTCGLAATDELGITIQPITTLRYKGISDVQRIFAELEKYFLELSPSLILVGLPYNMDGTEGHQSVKVREFVKAFQNYLKKKSIKPEQYQWEFFDERRTTVDAEEFLIENNTSRAKRKDIIDKMAAVFLLKSYLEEF